MKNIEGKTASRNEKTIKMKLYFFTDNFTEKGKILPKHCWTKGTVVMEANKSHGIETGVQSECHFNSLDDIPAAIEHVMEAHGITMYDTDKRLHWVTKVSADGKIVLHPYHPKKKDKETS
jgi:hypothetical protein